jgi:hypothetical protein
MSRFLVGARMVPNDQLFDSSFFRLAFGVETDEMLREQSSLSAPGDRVDAVRAADRIDEAVVEGLHAARRNLRQGRGAEAFGVAGAEGDLVGRFPLGADFRHEALGGRVLVVAAGEVHFEGLGERRAQFDEARLDDAAAIQHRVRQADDVAGCQFRIRGQAESFPGGFRRRRPGRSRRRPACRSWSMPWRRTAGLASSRC